MKKSEKRKKYQSGEKNQDGKCNDDVIYEFQPNHYVDNNMLLQELQKYFLDIKISKEQEKPKPKMPDTIGSAILSIATNLAKKSNFASYSYKDEMIEDAVENCLIYIENFNPEKSKNPFSYFTQITYYAFLRRIQREKKQQYIKYVMTQKADKTGKLRSYFKNNLETNEHKNYADEYAQYYDLSDVDLNSFKPSKKKVKDE